MPRLLRRRLLGTDKISRARRESAYALRVLALGPIAYYQLDEASGTTALDTAGSGYHGTYVNAAPGGTGIGDGQTGATFDGTGDVVTIGAAASHIDGDEGSILVWGKTAAWTDATLRYLVRFVADSADEVQIAKGTTNNQLIFRRISTDPVSVTSTALAGSTSYFCAILTWSVSGDALKAYINGAQVGTTQTGLQTLDGTILSTKALIGAGTNAGANSWSGGIAHVAIFDRVLSGAEALSLGVL